MSNNTGYILNNLREIDNYIIGFRPNYFQFMDIVNQRSMYDKVIIF